MLYILIAILATIPLIESRTAIIIAVGVFGLNPIISFVVAYLASILTIPFILKFTAPFLDYLINHEKTKRFGRRLRILIHRKGIRIQIKCKNRKNKKARAEALKKPLKLMALFGFVAIPFPFTGVWAGSLVAGVFKTNKRHAFWTLVLANLVATGIVTATIVGIIG